MVSVPRADPPHNSRCTGAATRVSRGPVSRQVYSDSRRRKLSCRETRYAIFKFVFLGLGITRARTRDTPARRSALSFPSPSWQGADREVAARKSPRVTRGSAGDPIFAIAILSPETRDSRLRRRDPSSDPYVAPPRPRQ